MIGTKKISAWAAVSLIICNSFSNGGNLPDISDTLTTNQRDALKQVRPIALKLASEIYMTTDSYLVRWLQVYDFDVEKTLEKIRQQQELRRINKISGILGEEFPAWIQEDFPITISSYDRQGRPVAIAAAGKYNLRRTSLKGQSEMMHRFGTMLFELMEVHLYELQCKGILNKNLLPQIVVIMDVAGTNYKEGACITCVAKLPKFLQMYVGNYPDMAQHTFFINVPRIIEVVLTTLISFVPLKIQQANHVYGLDKSEWSEVLLRQISFDQLPIAFGGGKITPKHTKQDKSVWNSNNPSLDAILQEYRQTNVSHSRNCASNVNIHISTEIPVTEHRHRHHHSENIPTHDGNMKVENINEPGNPEDDDWFIDNSWIDEIDTEDDTTSAEVKDEDDYLGSKQEKNSESSFGTIQLPFSTGNDVHKLDTCLSLMAILIPLTVFFVI